MRKLVLLALVALAAPAVPQGAVRHSGALKGVTQLDLIEIIPPARYRGDQAAITVFSHQAVRERCSLSSALACTKTYKDGSVILVLPNPCPLAGKELYATIVCHELGHLNGWAATHGD